MPKYSTLGILIFFIILTLPQPSQAYDDTYYYLQVEVFESQVLPRLKSRLTPADRAVINEVGITIVPSVSSPTLALTSENPPEIYISLGFLDGLFQHIDCILLQTSSAGFGDELCNRYFGYYFTEAIDGDGRHPLPVAAVTLPSDADTERWYSHQARQSARNLMFQSALITIFMHEYGHHFVGFYDANTSLVRMREIEGRADRWAFDRLEEIGESPALGAVLALGYIAHMEKYRAGLAEAAKNDPAFVQIDRAHPHPGQRVRWAYDLTCSVARQAESTAIRRACDALQEQIDNFD